MARFSFAEVPSTGGVGCSISTAMYAVFGILAVVLGLFQQNSVTPEQRQKWEAQARKFEEDSVRINDLAGRIKSEADARVLVDSIAELFAKELPPAWVTGQI